MKEYNATLIDYGEGKGKLVVESQFGKVTFAVKADSHMWVELERPHGEWIFDKDYPMPGSPYGSYKCSECGMHTDDDVDTYCWFCGADMRKEGEAE